MADLLSLLQIEQRSCAWEALGLRARRLGISLISFGLLLPDDRRAIDDASRSLFLDFRGAVYGFAHSLHLDGQCAIVSVLRWLSRGLRQTIRDLSISVRLDGRGNTALIARDYPRGGAQDGAGYSVGCGKPVSNIFAGLRSAQRSACTLGKSTLASAITIVAMPVTIALSAQGAK